MMKKLRNIIGIVTAFFVGFVVVSCNHLTDEAKQIIGNYYINEISDNVPLMELNDDGTAIYRTIKPEVITISAVAKWNVVGDSLTFDIDRAKVTCDGDSSIVGKIPTHISKHVIAHDEWTLTLEQNGVNYVYYRRNSEK